MADTLTKANINLFAVIRNLEDLCELDHEAKSLIKDKNISLEFFIKNGSKGFLNFESGKCRFTKEDKPCDIKLFFKSPQHFNDMIDGKANPIPTKGITKINFLKNEFIKLTEKLSFYLKPTDNLLADKNYFKINTYLTAYTAFFALAQIGNTDKIGKVNASRIPDGIISISVVEGPCVYLEVKNGHIEAHKGSVASPRAYMIFDSLKTANGLLNGKLDSYTCIGDGKIQVKGFIPMIDNMNKILAMVPSYLK